MANDAADEIGQRFFRWMCRHFNVPTSSRSYCTNSWNRPDSSASNAPRRAFRHSGRCGRRRAVCFGFSVAAKQLRHFPACVDKPQAHQPIEVLLGRFRRSAHRLAGLFGNLGGGWEAGDVFHIFKFGRKTPRMQAELRTANWMCVSRPKPAPGYTGSPSKNAPRTVSYSIPRSFSRARRSLMTRQSRVRRLPPPASEFLRATVVADDDASKSFHWAAAMRQNRKAIWSAGSAR